MAKRKSSIAGLSVAGPSEAFPPPPKSKRQRTARTGAIRRSDRLKRAPPPDICRINLFPTEILVSIFKEVQELYEAPGCPLGPPLESVYVLGHVCQRWRDIMINCPPQILLTSVFSDRRDEHRSQDVSSESTTMSPTAVAEISREYKIKLLALAVFTGNSRDIFRFDMQQRVMKRRELEIRDLCILGLNHRSAEFILTTKFTNLQSITIMHTQTSRVCQIVSIMKTPIFCEKLIIQATPVRDNELCISTPHMKTIRHRFYTQNIRINSKSALGRLPFSHRATRMICSPAGFEVRKFKTVPPLLEKLVLSNISAFEIKELGLDIGDLRELDVGISRFDSDGRRWHATEETGFWSGLLRAGKKLEKLTISGLTHVEDIADLPQALKGLDPECEVNFSRTIPINVIKELKKKSPMMEFMRVCYGS